MLSASALLLFGTFFVLSLHDVITSVSSNPHFSKVPVGRTGSDGSNVLEVSGFVLVVTGFVTAILFWEVRNAWNLHGEQKEG